MNINIKDCANKVDAVGSKIKTLYVYMLTKCYMQHNSDLITFQLILSTVPKFYVLSQRKKKCFSEN